MSTCSSKRTGDPGGTQLMNTLAACVMKICSTFYIRESFLRNNWSTNRMISALHWIYLTPSTDADVIPRRRIIEYLSRFGTDIISGIHRFQHEKWHFHLSTQILVHRWIIFSVAGHYLSMYPVAIERQDLPDGWWMLERKQESLTIQLHDEIDVLSGSKHHILYHSHFISVLVTTTMFHTEQSHTGTRFTQINATWCRTKTAVPSPIFGCRTTNPWQVNPSVDQAIQVAADGDCSAARGSDWPAISTRPRDNQSAAV